MSKTFFLGPVIVVVSALHEGRMHAFYAFTVCFLKEQGLTFKIKYSL